MSDECHTLLKQYCAMFGITMSEMLYECARQEIHQTSQKVKTTANLLEVNNIKPDKRIDKPCWSAACFFCFKEKACRIGVYQEFFVPNDSVKSNLIDPEETFCRD